jgi:hypothetical protein
MLFFSLQTSNERSSVAKYHSKESINFQFTGHTSEKFIVLLIPGLFRGINICRSLIDWSELIPPVIKN